MVGTARVIAELDAPVSPAGPPAAGLVSGEDHQGDHRRQHQAGEKRQRPGLRALLLALRTGGLVRSTSKSFGHEGKLLWIREGKPQAVRPVPACAAQTKTPG